MINVTEAVQKAFEYIRELLPREKLDNLMLEEVEYKEREQEWLVTLRS